MTRLSLKDVSPFAGTPKKAIDETAVYSLAPTMSKRTQRARPPRPATSRRRKALGQHFLSNNAAARSIVERFAPRPGERVIEIGPGRGALTDHLIAAGARVVAVELDARLAQALRLRHAAAEGFHLVTGDVLSCDIAGLCDGAPARLLANIPYAITGELIARLLLASPPLTAMTLMVQKEVADRIVAGPGSRTYGSLSVLTQYFTDPRLEMALKPGSFSPPPAVVSAVVAMPFRMPRELDAGAEKAFPRFVRDLFGSRRQTLRNNLRRSGLLQRSPSSGTIAAAEARIAAAGVDLARRPETLSRDEILLLHRLLMGM
jgi:16S rRNA (adenine1518-N6/adenine1519-N6)-dimethyltransferase